MKEIFESYNPQNSSKKLYEQLMTYQPKIELMKKIFEWVIVKAANGSIQKNLNHERSKTKPTDKFMNYKDNTKLNPNNRRLKT